MESLTRRETPKFYHLLLGNELATLAINVNLTRAVATLSPAMAGFSIDIHYNAPLLRIAIESPMFMEPHSLLTRVYMKGRSNSLN
jgi:hypothetical protein